MPIMTVILSQQFWQMKANTYQHITIQNTLATVLKMLDLYLLGHYCLHLTFKPYLSSKTYSRKYEKLPNIFVHACKILQKRYICWKCLARKFGFVCLRFDPLRRNSSVHSQLTRWCSGNASALGARGPGFNPWLRQGFLCLMLCFVVVVFLLFCPKTHYSSQKFAISLAILIYLLYLTYCNICDRL